MIVPMTVERTLRNLIHSERMTDMREGEEFIILRPWRVVNIRLSLG